MGVFDHLRCDYPLPAEPEPPTARDRFQTKDADAQWLELYTITADGRLVHHSVTYEAVPEAERPYPEMPFIGSIRSVAAGDVEVPFHGDLTFCTTEGRTFWDYVARFTEGRCVRIWCADRSELPPNVITTAAP